MQGWYVDNVPMPGMECHLVTVTRVLEFLCQYIICCEDHIKLMQCITEPVAVTTMVHAYP